MDKSSVINIDKFLAHFSEPENQIVFNSPRYLASQINFQEVESGTCFFKEIQMPQITMLELEFNLKKDLRILDQMPQVSSVFVLEGAFSSCFSGLSKNAAPGQQRHNLLYTPEDISEHTFHQGVFRAVHLSYDLDFFKSLLDADNPRFEAVIQAMEKKMPLLIGPTALPLPIGMQQSLRDMQQCQLQGATRHLYLEAKALELFTWQIEQVQAAMTPKADPGISKIDVEKLHQVKDFIHKNYLQPLTLTDLALQFGLNEFKLKNGYKKLFGSPIFQTIHYLRMQTAADLLQNNIMNISEVSDFVGYSHVSHFSTAFKKKFGYPPSTSQKFKPTTFNASVEDYR